MRFILLLILLTPSVLFCQISNKELVGLNVSEHLKLPSTETYKVKQDSKGYIWVCSDGGVIRYNGASSRLFTKEDGLFSNAIFDIYEDPKGRIWFTGNQTDLCYLENDSIKKYPYNNLIKNKINNQNRIWKSIRIDKEDNLYYSIYGIGILKITSNGKISLTSDLDGIQYHSFEGNEFLTSINLHKKSYINNRETLISSIPFYFQGKKKNINIDIINSVIEDPVIYGTDTLSILFSTLVINQDLYDQEEDYIYLEPHKEKLSIATSNGFQFFTIKNGKLVQESKKFLPDEFITSILSDKNGNIWVSTLENGIYYFQDINLYNIPFTLTVPSKRINQIFNFKEKYYAVTFEEIINLTYNSSEISSENAINFVFTTPKHIFISNSNRNFIDKHYPYQFLPFIRDAKWDSTGIYLASSHCIQKLDTLKDHLPYFISVLDDTTFTYAKTIEIIDKHSLLHAGVNNLQILQKGRIIRNFDGNFDIQQMIKINRDSILLLDANKGYYLFKTNTYELSTLETINQKLPSAVYQKFAYDFDTKTLYTCSDKGIIYSNLNGKHLNIITDNNGLTENRIYSVYAKNGTVYFSTKNNIYQYTPSKTFVEANEDVIIIGHLQYSDNKIQPFNLGESFRVNSTEKLLTIKLDVLKYENWNNKSFQFRTSKKNAWITTNTPEFVLTNLNGNYSIEMRYKTHLNKWSEAISISKISIIPPFYLRFPLYFVYVVTLVFIIYVLVRVYLQRKITKLQLQNDLLSYHQRLQNARIKPHFIFNVLNSINSHILFNENKEASNYLIKFSKLLRKILDNSGSENINLKSEETLLSSYLDLEKQRQGNKLHFEIDFPKHKPLIKFPSLMLQPFVENAIIHGCNDDNLKCEIKIRVEYINDKTICFSVFNNAQMSDEAMRNWEKSSTNNAVGIIRDRLNNYKKLYKNSDLSLTITRDTKGSTVTIILPIVE